jgi:uncharacterized protein YecT (DUF1311 family)
MKIFKFVILYLLLTTGFESDAQTHNQINLLSQKYTDSLEAGHNPLDHSIRYYKQMDSFLNVAYSNLLSRLSIKGKDSLKSKQLSWLRKRNSYFKKLDKEFKTKLENGELELFHEFIYLTSRTLYVKDRVEELIYARNTIDHLRELNIYSKGISNLYKPLSQREQFILHTIRSLREVKALEAWGKQQENFPPLIFAIWEKPAGSKKDYWIKVVGQNGNGYFTHFNFLVNPESFKIKYIDNLITDGTIELDLWRLKSGN